MGGRKNNSCKRLITTARRGTDEDDVRGWDRFFEKAKSLLQVLKFKFVSAAAF